MSLPHLISSEVHHRRYWGDKEHAQHLLLITIWLTLDLYCDGDRLGEVLSSMRVGASALVHSIMSWVLGIYYLQGGLQTARGDISNKSVIIIPYEEDLCTSICSKGVGWSWSVQVMVGIGTPAEEQEMFTLSPSLSITVLLLVTVVLAPTEGINVYE